MKRDLENRPPMFRRDLFLRARPDLVVQPLNFGKRRAWGVKDPVSLRYFQLGDEEHFILGCLDGRTSLAELKARFEQRFAPRKLDAGHLQSFLGLLFRQGMLLSDAKGQGAQLLERNARQRRRALLGPLSNLLAIRLPGINPDRFLTWLYPYCRWLLSPWCVAVWAALALAALLLVVVQAEELRARLPEFTLFFSPSNLLWLAAVIALTKVIHELSHGIACRHFGGRCHEMGVMLLVFMPCLYCNVSDAWLLPSKWQRAAIGFAGIYAEIALASLATFGWWFTHPGTLNAILLDIMIVCSVGTLLINGNPLLRFDGYFILADVTGVANLSPRATAVIADWAKKWLLGIERERQSRPEPHTGWLAAYAVLAFAYRLTVVTSILFFLNRVFRAYGMELFWTLLVGAVAAGILVPPLWKSVELLRDPSMRREMRTSRMIRAGMLLALVLLGTLLAPLPARVRVPVFLQAERASSVYVTTPGTLRGAVEAGREVITGEVLAKLENKDVQRDVAKLAGELEVQRIRLANLQAARVREPALGQQIPVAEEALRDLQQRLEQRQLDERRLTLVTPAAGTVLPPPNRQSPRQAGHLPSWSGSPLDAQNHGAFLPTGTLLCRIGDPDRMEGLLVIDQSQVQQVRPGQPVRARIEQLPGRLLEGRIRELSEVRLETIPPELLASGLVRTRPDNGGELRLLDTSFLARVSFDQPTAPLLPGAWGRAQIYVAPQTLGSRLYRALRSVMRFEL